MLKEKHIATLSYLWENKKNIALIFNKLRLLISINYISICFVGQANESPLERACRQNSNRTKFRTVGPFKHARLQTLEKYKNKRECV